MILDNWSPDLYNNCCWAWHASTHNLSPGKGWDYTRCWIPLAILSSTTFTNSTICCQIALIILEVEFHLHPICYIIKKALFSSDTQWLYHKVLTGDNRLPHWDKPPTGYVHIKGCLFQEFPEFFNRFASEPEKSPFLLCIPPRLL